MPSGFATNDERELRVRLERRRSVRDVDAEILEPARPGDVVRLVEPRLELDEHRDLLAALRRLDERVDDRRVARRAIERQLDREHVVVFGGRLEKALDASRVKESYG